MLNILVFYWIHTLHTHSLNFHNYLEFNIYFYYVRIKEWTLISQLLILFLLCSIFIKFLYIRKFFVRAFTSLCTTLLTSIVIPFLLNKQLITMLGIVWNNYGSWKSILQHQRYDFWDITFFLKLVFLNSMYSLHSFQNRTGPDGPTVNRWGIRFELLIGSVMQLDRCKPARLDKNRWLGRFF